VTASCGPLNHSSMRATKLCRSGGKFIRRASSPTRLLDVIDLGQTVEKQRGVAGEGEEVWCKV